MKGIFNLPVIFVSINKSNYWDKGVSTKSLSCQSKSTEIEKTDYFGLGKYNIQQKLYIVKWKVKLN